MIISNKNKYIYFHNPKCAGTTIGKILAKSCCSHDILVGGYRSRARDSVEFDKNSMLYRKKHISVTELEQMNYIDLSDYFKFGFTRNPYSWAVSWYAFWFKWQGGRSRKVPSKKHWWKIKHMNFSEFLRYEWFTNTKTAADIFFSVAKQINNLLISSAKLKTFKKILILSVTESEFQSKNFHIQTKVSINIILNTTMTKRKKSLRKNMPKTLSILIISLENKNDKS